MPHPVSESVPVERVHRYYLMVLNVIKSLSQRIQVKVSLKADLDGTIFAYDYRARLAYVMTSRQIVSCKLDPRHSYDMWMS